MQSMVASSSIWFKEACFCIHFPVLSNMAKKTAGDWEFVDASFAAEDGDFVVVGAPPPPTTPPPQRTMFVPGDKVSAWFYNSYFPGKIIGTGIQGKRCGCCGEPATISVLWDEDGSYSILPPSHCK